MGGRFAPQLGAPLTAQSIEIEALEVGDDRQQRSTERQRPAGRWRRRALRRPPGVIARVGQVAMPLASPSAWAGGPRPWRAAVRCDLPGDQGRSRSDKPNLQRRVVRGSRHTLVCAARQRPPLALTSVGPLARRLRHDADPLQMQLEPSVAPAEAVVLHQMLVEVLDREARVALAIEPLHILRPISRAPLARRLAKPPVDEAGLALLLVAPRPAPERPLAHPEQLGRLLPVQLRRFPAAEKIQKHRHAHPLKGFRPAHPHPPKGLGLTGQIVRYLNRTYRLLPTLDRTISGGKPEIAVSLPHEEPRISAGQNLVLSI